MNLQWGKIRSFHAIMAPVYEGQTERKTLCGLFLKPGAEIREELPKEKSCERCLRSFARLTDYGERP